MELQVLLKSRDGITGMLYNEMSLQACITESEIQTCIITNEMELQACITTHEMKLQACITSHKMELQVFIIIKRWITGMYFEDGITGMYYHPRDVFTSMYSYQNFEL